MNWMKSFGRLRGRNCDSEKMQGLSKFLINPENFDFTSKNVNLEIGFGYGEHLVSRAKANLDEIFVGAEVYLNGLIKILKVIDEENIKNILLWNKDARILLEMMPNHILNKIFLLFPDPWPKKRHHKRRIINQKFLILMKNKLKTSGKIIVATDHEEYAGYIETEAKNVFLVKNIDDQIIDTRYKRKSDSPIHAYMMYNYA